MKLFLKIENEKGNFTFDSKEDVNIPEAMELLILYMVTSGCDLNEVQKSILELKEVAKQSI